MTSRTGNRILDAAVDHLNLEELQEFADASDYLKEKAGSNNPSGHIAEGSIGRLMNSLSPRVKAAFQNISRTIESPRHRPFHEKFSETDQLVSMGFGHEAQMVKDVLDVEEVAGRIQQDLGTDADLPEQPLTMRDNISAAFDAHSGEQDG